MGDGLPHHLELAGSALPEVSPRHSGFTYLKNFFLKKLPIFDINYGAARYSEPPIRPVLSNRSH